MLRKVKVQSKGKASRDIAGDIGISDTHLTAAFLARRRRRRNGATVASPGEEIE
jgi:hypothetical protein